MTFRHSLAEACLLAEPYTNTRCGRRQLAYLPRWRKDGAAGVKARKIGAAAKSSAFLLESIAGGRSNSSRNSSRFAALNDKAPERGHSSFRITSIGYDLQPRLHPFAEEIDGHVAALAALEILHIEGSPGGPP